MSLFGIRSRHTFPVWCRRKFYSHIVPEKQQLPALFRLTSSPSGGCRLSKHNTVNKNILFAKFLRICYAERRKIGQLDARGQRFCIVYEHRIERNLARRPDCRIGVSMRGVGINFGRQNVRSVLRRVWY